MIKLGVNIDHIATLREVRKAQYPDVLKAARIIAEETEAFGITTHLREDRRHIQDEDVYAIRKSIKKPLNLEMSINEEIVQIALDVKPYSCCLVPERRAELTTEGGLDVINNFERIKHVVTRLKNQGIIVSIFIEPDKQQIKAAHEVGADYIEIHTGKYANLRGKERYEELQRIKEAAYFADELGLKVNAGHGLNYNNVEPLIDITVFREFNIGHSIIAEAVFVGIKEAVNKMLRLLGYNV